MSISEFHFLVETQHILFLGGISVKYIKLQKEKEERNCDVS